MRAGIGMGRLLVYALRHSTVCPDTVIEYTDRPYKNLGDVLS